MFAACVGHVCVCCVCYMAPAERDGGVGSVTAIFYVCIACCLHLLLTLTCEAESFPRSGVRGVR